MPDFGAQLPSSRTTFLGFAGRNGKVKVTGSRWGNLVSPCVVQVPKDAVLLGEGVKAQVVKSGLRPLALGRWVVHHIPSRSERDLGKCSGTTPKNRECGAQQAQCKYKNSAPGENFNRMRCQKARRMWDLNPRGS